MTTTPEQRAQMRRWALANPEKRREIARQYYCKHQERLRAEAQARAAANPEQVKEASRQWRLANPEKAKQSTRNWQQRNPEKVAEYKRRRREREQQDPALHEKRREHCRRYRRKRGARPRGEDRQIWAAICRIPGAFPHVLALWLRTLEEQRIENCESARRWAAAHPDVIKAKEDRYTTSGRRNEKARRWQLANPEKVIAYKEAARQRRLADWKPRPKPTPEELAARKRAYRRAYKTRHHFITNAAKRIYNATRGRASKSARTQALVGCPEAELRAHLEKFFLPGMTWENRAEWHVDHRRPCASFDLRRPEQQRECFHFSNLQPLWKKDNLRKQAHWAGKSWRFTT